jgi:transposase
MESLAWLSSDLGKGEFYAALAVRRLSGNDWRKLPTAVFAFSEAGILALLAWLKEQGVSPGELDGVCIESTGRLAQQFVTLANGRLGEISIINPARSKSFMQSLAFGHKNDRVDARMLAYYGQQMRPKPQGPRDAAYVKLREMSRAYEDMQTLCQAEQCRLADGPECKQVCAMLGRVIRMYKREMAAMQKKIKDLIEKTPALKQDAERIVGVPGLGPRTAQLLLAEFADLRDYNRDEVVALAGLYPRQHESGTSVRKAPRIARAGKANVRAVLYMAAMSAVRFNPAMKQFAQRLSANGKKPMQVLVAVMRKLLLIAHALIVNNTTYDPEHLTTSKAAVSP